MTAATTRKSNAKSKRQRRAKIKWHNALADVKTLAELVVEAQAGNTVILYVVALEKLSSHFDWQTGDHLESYPHLSPGQNTQLNCVHKGLSCTFTPVTYPQSEAKTRAVYLSIIHF